MGGAALPRPRSRRRHATRGRRRCCCCRRRGAARRAPPRGRCFRSSAALRWLARSRVASAGGAAAPAAPLYCAARWLLGGRERASERERMK
eukprot:scaffold306_cov525-Prasinococcus_capsulatus_cf.AAC.4